MSQPGSAPAIEIRHCTTLAEFEECVRLEHVTWGEEIAVPSGLFVVALHTGGQALGAFAGGKMVGFTLALAGSRGMQVANDPVRWVRKAFLHSHMTAVLPEFRDRGIGRGLKLFQREDAIRRGIDLIEWTFDPLELKNAYFNLIRLGAVARRLIPNCYGITASPLHAGMPTDRLVAEWWLLSDRVKSTVANEPFSKTGKAERLSLPANIGAIKAKDRATAIRIQDHLRGQLQKWFAKGYAVSGIETDGNIANYILEPAHAMTGSETAPKTEE